MNTSRDSGGDPGEVRAEATAGPEAPARAPDFHPWRTAALAPAVLAVPWLLLTRGVEAPGFGTVGGLVLVLLVGCVSLTDLRWRWVPNWATYTAAAWAFLLQLVAAVTPPDAVVPVPSLSWLRGRATLDPEVGELLGVPPFGDAVLGFLVGFGVMLLLYSLFRGGAGDVKLAAAIGALVGAGRVLEVLVVGYIAAAVFGACYLVWTVGPLGLLRELALALGVLRRRPGEGPAGGPLKQRIPMAPFLGFGALLTSVWRP